MQEKTTDSYGIMIAKKAERLVTALYLVTDLIDGSEPIKNGLRKNAIVLLSSMNALAQHEIKDKMTEFSTSLKAVTEITSLLHVAGATGLVSDMNATLLIDGFRVLQLVLEKKQTVITKEMLTISSEESLYEDYFSQKGQIGIHSTSYDALTPRSLMRTQDEQRTEELEAKRGGDIGGYGSGNDEVIKGQKQQQQMPSSQVGRIGQGKEETPKTTTLHGVLMQHAQGKRAQLSSSFQSKKQTRREQIKALFVKGVDVSIKDISLRIKGCSEKTIQRELNALVYDNIIERIGEKRWSRYVLL